MLRNDIYLIIHRLVACNLCLLNSRFVSLNQKPTCKNVIKQNSIGSILWGNYFHGEA